MRIDLIALWGCHSPSRVGRHGVPATAATGSEVKSRSVVYDGDPSGLFA
ncbi:hypothetical protein LQK93_03755 [Terrabacter sp. BE26]